MLVLVILGRFAIYWGAWRADWTLKGRGWSEMAGRREYADKFIARVAAISA